MDYFAAFDSSGLGPIYNKLVAGERLNFEDGMTLMNCGDINALGALAHHVRCQKHGAKAHYVVNRQINYTNVCVNDCIFCAFHRNSDAESGAFRLSHAEILTKIDNAMQGKLRLDELHMVGGCHPDIPFAWFIELFHKIREKFPQLPLKAFTPVEIAHFAQLENSTTIDILARLKQAGLVMLPGGGAEIFDENLRQKLCPRKANASEWLRISGEAHGLGLKTNCTMLFGHLETAEHRIDHLLRLREQQDKSGGFVCFIPLPFLKKNSRLKLPEDRRGPGEALDQLRMIAVSRLVLDNIPHIKAYWIMLGAKLAQTALWYGADDLDGTIVEEHIGHMAGAKSHQGLTIAELDHMIRESGFVPTRRNAVFENLEIAGLS